MNHALSTQLPLDRMFSHGPFPAGGDADTVCQISTAAGKNNEYIAPSYRQIVDLGNLSTSKGMVVPGQSGHLASPPYCNYVKHWFDGDYFRLGWADDDMKELPVVVWRSYPLYRKIGTMFL